jgi:predicted RNA-binding Zn-ribbon protein involved in translation (DUF1610 family)
MDLAGAMCMILQPSPSPAVGSPHIAERERLRGLLDRLAYTRQEPQHQTLLAKVERAVEQIGFTTTLHTVGSPFDRVVQLKCPACGSPVQRDHPSPKSPFLYQCEACHVELILDVRTGQLLISPLDPAFDPRR